MASAGGEPDGSDAGAARVAVVDEPGGSAGLGMMRGRQPANVPSIADRIKGQHGDCSVLGGVQGSGQPMAADAGSFDEVVRHLPPEGLRREPRRRKVERFVAHDRSVSDRLALEGDNVAFDLHDPQPVW